jgi:diguanylate cyclase (GGDEF)-like protein
MSANRNNAATVVRPTTPAGGERTRIGANVELRRRLPGPRRRPLLVRAYGALFRQEGSLGPVVRRRAVQMLLRTLPTMVGAGTVVLLHLGALAPPVGQTHALVAGILLVTLAILGVRRTAHAARGESAGTREQLELGSLFLIVAYLAAQASGDPGGSTDGPLYPVVYLVMACLVAFLSRGVGLALVGLAIAVETLLALPHIEREGALPTLVAHATFIALFALLYHAVLAAQVASGRRAQRAAVDRRLREIEERAREYRLVASGSSEGGDAEEMRQRWTAGSVMEVEAAVRGALEVAEVALKTHTCAFFVLTPDDKQLLLRECRSRSETVTRQALPAGEGALGVVVLRRAPVRLHGDFKAATYYEDGTRPRALLAVPFIDRRGDHLRGVLVADRLEDVAFTEADEQLLATVASELLRAVASERLMSDMKRTRDEKERFYQAIERLNRATKLTDVFQVAMEAAGGVIPVDFGALTLVGSDVASGARGTHQIVRALVPEGTRPVASALEGREFADNSGLVSAAVRLGSSLPGRELKPSEAVVFDEGTRLKGLSTIKVFPLKAGEAVLGTLVLGSKRRGAFDPDTTRMLEMMALQAAQSIQRARLFEQAERMAITDGLTGLLNHRTFQTRMDECLAAATRYGKRLSLIIADIDHFKAVNDTYGHPIGDLVLKGVAQVLQAEARTTDLVARYGGEEFSILMPETDADGAAVIAERIREKVQGRVFDTENGPLTVTLSLGIATYPDDGQVKAALIDLADASLYHAKRQGRNRSVAARACRAGKAQPAR